MPQDVLAPQMHKPSMLKKSIFNEKMYRPLSPQSTNRVPGLGPWKVLKNEALKMSLTYEGRGQLSDDIILLQALSMTPSCWEMIPAR
jgi:hypothetical protein